MTRTEGPHTQNENAKVYKYTPDSLRNRVLSISIEENVRNSVLNNLGSALMEHENRLLSPAITTEENKIILEIVDELNARNMDGDFSYAIARYFNFNLYSREELISILAAINSYQFIHGMLSSGAGKIVFKDMTNEEIRSFCTKMIQKFSGKITGVDDSTKRYALFSAHEGYRFWDGALDLIKLEGDLNQIIQEGVDLGDEFIWEKILKDEKANLKELPYDERMVITKRIVNSIQIRRGLAVTNSFPTIEDFERNIHFGNQLSSKILNILFSN